MLKFPRRRNLDDLITRLQILRLSNKMSSALSGINNLNAKSEEVEV